MSRELMPSKDVQRPSATPSRVTAAVAVGRSPYHGDQDVHILDRIIATSTETADAVRLLRSAIVAETSEPASAAPK